jgi:selenocysteine lyase/cysteine desulfurase
MRRDSANLAQKIYENQYCSSKRIPGPFGERFITYADYIASGQPLRFLENYIQQQVLPTYANTHTEVSYTGRQTGHFREEARQLIRKSVNANAEDAVVFCGSGSTGAIDKLVRQFHKEGAEKPIVFLGPYEHHSNVLPWREGGFEIIAVPVTDEGLIDLVFLEENLKLISKSEIKRVIIGSFSAASNVTGTLAPVDEITTILHTYGAYSFWDYAAAASYLQVDMNPGGLANKDAIFISPHKTMGGPGTPGILVVKRKIFEGDVPTMPSGGTVEFVTKTQQRYYRDIEVREEGGTPAIIESIRAGLVFKLKDAVGADYITEREHDFISRAFHRFEQNPNVFILGNTKAPRLGFMAFHIRHEGYFLHHNFVVTLLNDLFGIQSRGGCSCAGPYGHDLLGITEAKSQAHIEELATGNMASKPGWVRLNFNYFLPEAEFQFIVDAVLWIADNGWKLLKTYNFDDRTALWTVKGKVTPISSLNDFLNEETAVPSFEMIDKEQDRIQYFHQANEIADQALSNWETIPCQNYHYKQVDNPLRWYALSADIGLASLLPKGGG